MSTSILDVIGHYQRSIERAQKQNNPLVESKSAKFLHCIEKLNKLRVKVEHLQATGIGKTVNSLRKCEGEVGIAAKALVAKWKEVVTAEESAKDQAARNIKASQNNDGNNGDRGNSIGNINTNDNLPTSSNNGYTSERESIQLSQHQYNASNNADRQQQTNKNFSFEAYQNRKGNDNNRQSTSYDMLAKIPALNIKPLVPLDPNYVHTIEDDDDDNEVQLIIDENISNHVKASPQLNSSTVNAKSDKYGNAINQSSKNRDQVTKKDKHQKRHSSERKNDSENRKNNSSHLSSLKLTDSNRFSNHILTNQDDAMLNHEPPSAAEVCQEDMYNERIPYDNSISEISIDRGSSSMRNVEDKSNKNHKDLLNETEHLGKKKKSKKHKEKKSKSKHHDSNEDSNRQSDSKHEKKHKDKNKLSKDKTSKEKKLKEISVVKSDEKECIKIMEENEKINISNIYKQTSNDQKLSISIEHQNEVSSTTMSPSKIKKSKNELVNDNGIDSTTGASFEQALEMMTMPKKSKNQIKNLNESLTEGFQNETLITKKRLSRDEPSGSGIVNKKFKLSQTKVTSNSDSESDVEIGDSKSNTPLLLSSNATLKPLDPSIALDLPTISNNYKPMPLNPTVMECVFPQSKPQKMMNDEEALAHGISSKTIRTKVYSGAKIGQKVQVPTLFNLCIRCLQKNIDALEYTGGVPFDILRPVLERATPEQLSQFEEYNPYLMEDTDILWEHHVKRRFRQYKREEMESYREMYMRCKESQDAHLNRLRENIKQSQIQTSLPQRKTQLAYVDSLVKPPRYVKKKQERFGTNDKLVATPAARVAALQAITPNATKSSDARLRVTPGTRDNAQVTSAPRRKAPLMAKTLQFMRGRIRR